MMSRTINFSVARRNIFILITIIASSAVPGRADETFDRILANVKQSEQLYENIEVEMQSENLLADQASAVKIEASVNAKKPASEDEDGATPDESAPQGANTIVPYRSISKHINYVRQDGLFRIETTGQGASSEGDVSQDAIRAFDGTMTRLFEQKAIGNLIHGEIEDDGFVRPHMLLLRMMRFIVPLSTYMSGHEAMAQYPSSGWDQSMTLENTYQGEDEFQGLRCHKIWLTTAPVKGQPHDRWELWLAEVRNYITVSLREYTFRFSKDVPVSEGVVSEFVEVKPGVWFPEAARIDAYAQPFLQHEGIQRLCWSEANAIEKVSLDPHYDSAFYRNVEFPDGVAIYEIQNGQITRSYVQGQTDAAELKPRARRKWI